MSTAAEAAPSEHAIRCRLLATSDGAALRSIAERALQRHDVAEQLVVVAPPETGTVVLQVREPVCEERFLLGDVLVTRAEVAIGATRGWSIRLGADRGAALAAAICDAIAGHDDPRLADLRGDVDCLCRRTEEVEQRRDLAEWAELTATAVNFEELD